MGKKILLLFVFSFFLGFSPVEAKQASTLDIGKGSATVSYLKGAAEILEPGKEAWTSLQLKDVLEEGDRVRTKSGAQMELTLACVGRCDKTKAGTALAVNRSDLNGVQCSGVRHDKKHFRF